MFFVHLIIALVCGIIGCFLILLTDKIRCEEIAITFAGYVCFGIAILLIIWLIVSSFVYPIVATTTFPEKYNEATQLYEQAVINDDRVLAVHYNSLIQEVNEDIKQYYQCAHWISLTDVFVDRLVDYPELPLLMEQDLS